MDFLPRHRLPFPLPAPWPAGVGALLDLGALWLHSGDTGGGLVALPGPPVRSRWEAGGWQHRLGNEPLSGSPWEVLEAVVARSGLPWIGAATYELCCDEAALPRKDLPPGALGQHWAPVREALHLGPEGAELWSWGETPPDPSPWRAALASPEPPAQAWATMAPLWSQDQHQAAVAAIQARILDGGFYVANLCVPFQGALSGTPAGLARAALARARAPFGAALPLEGLFLLCLSMERLLARRGRRLWSQPIKGSAPLTGRRETDERAAEALRADPKERAEHTMILDLIRNDLGRVAEAGSVRVSRAMEVETYPTVQHLVSTVEATARGGLTLPELLRALLPGGSVTGTPKHAVCAHLAQAEAGPRGFYCGAAGWLGPGGDLDLALPIRTAQITEDRVTYWAGGGITRRSDPDREWAELGWKTRVIAP